MKPAGIALDLAAMMVFDDSAAYTGLTALLSEAKQETCQILLQEVLVSTRARPVYEQSKK